MEAPTESHHMTDTTIVEQVYNKYSSFDTLLRHGHITFTRCSWIDTTVVHDTLTVTKVFTHSSLLGLLFGIPIGIVLAILGGLALKVLGEDPPEQEIKRMEEGGP